MGPIIVILAINPLFHVLLMDVLISVAHHRRDEIAVFPVGVSLIFEHGFLCGVFLVFEGDDSFCFGECGGDVLVLDYEGGDIVA